MDEGQAVRTEQNFTAASQQTGIMACMYYTVYSTVQYSTVYCKLLNTIDAVEG